MPTGAPRVTRAALVLGAAVWPGGEPSPTLARRITAAAELYHGGAVRVLIVSGGVGHHAPSEADVMARHLVAQGVPEDAILRETRARTTFENIAFSLPLLPEAAPITIVTDFYHLPRALLCARRLGVSARGATPPLKGANPLFTIKAMLREIPAFVFYVLRPVPQTPAKRGK